MNRLCGETAGFPVRGPDLRNLTEDQQQHDITVAGEL